MSGDLTLDLERLKPILTQGPPPLFATVSGAHLYGFASADSDVDLWGRSSGGHLWLGRGTYGLGRRTPRVPGSGVLTVKGS